MKCLGSKSATAAIARLHEVTKTILLLRESKSTATLSWPYLPTAPTAVPTAIPTVPTAPRTINPFYRTGSITAKSACQIYRPFEFLLDEAIDAKSRPEVISEGDLPQLAKALDRCLMYFTLEFSCCKSILSGGEARPSHKRCSRYSGARKTKNNVHHVPEKVTVNTEKQTYCGISGRIHEKRLF